MPLRPLFKNKLLLQKHYNTTESDLDMLPYWQFEEYISIINEIADEEEKHRKEEEGKQEKSIPNFNPSSYMKDMSSLTNKFK